MTKPEFRRYEKLGVCYRISVVNSTTIVTFRKSSDSAAISAYLRLKMGSDFFLLSSKLEIIPKARSSPVPARPVPSTVQNMLEKSTLPTHKKAPQRYVL